jgi:hypothetical protein
MPCCCDTRMDHCEKSAQHPLFFHDGQVVLIIRPCPLSRAYLHLVNGITAPYLALPYLFFKNRCAPSNLAHARMPNLAVPADLPIDGSIPGRRRGARPHAARPRWFLAGCALHWRQCRSAGHNAENCRLQSGGLTVGQEIQRICAAISEQTKRTWVFLDPDEMVGRLNRMLRGWANYFTLGAVSVAYGTVDRHVCFRLRQWLGHRERVQASSRSRYSEPYLRRTFRLIKLEGRPHRLLWAVNIRRTRGDL